MKILQLNLQAYGPFTEAIIDLECAQPGLHVIYGDNEAGKTSALRAIHSALFGIPVRTTDSFLHPNNTLRVGATLLNADGQQLSFVRRKGNKSTLLGTAGTQGTALPDNALAPFVGQIDGDGYRRIFGIDHQQMRSGGETLQSLRGLVGESLFAASIGGPELMQLIESLRSEAGQLFSSNRGKSELKVALKEYKEHDKRRRDSRVSESQWRKLRKALESARQDQAEHSQRLKSLRTQHLRLQRLESAVPAMNEYRRLIANSAQYDQVLILPQEYSQPARIQCQNELSRVEAQIQQLTESMEGEQGLTQQLAAITVTEDILPYESDIRELQEQCGAIRKARTDIQKRRQQQEDLVRTCQRLLRDIDPNTSLDTVEKLRIRTDVRDAIRALANDEKHVREESQRLIHEQQDIQRQQQQLNQRLDGLPKPLDLTQLSTLMKSIHRQGDLQTLRNQRCNDLKQEQSIFDRQLAALPLWNGTAEQFGQLELPLRETVEQFEQQLATAASQLSRLQSELAQTIALSTAVDQEIASMRAHGHVPTQAELDDVRTQRSETWQAIRRQFEQWSIARDEAGEGSRDHWQAYDETQRLYTTFESQIDQADRIADRLRQDADRVAQLSERLERQSDLQNQTKELEQQVAESQQELANTNADWQQAWRSANLTRILTPREMRSWLDSVEKLQSKQQHLESVEREVATIDERYRRCVEQLQHELNQHHAESTLSDLDPLMAVGESLEAAQLALTTQRHEIKRDLERLDSQLERLQHDHDRAKDARETWQKRWASAMTQIGCPIDAPAEQAHSRLDQLQRLFDTHDEINELADRVAKMESDEQTFADMATSLAANVKLIPLTSENDSNLEPVLIATTLRRHLDTAIRDDERRKELQTSLDKANQQLQKQQTRFAELKSQLAEFCRMAQVNDPSKLADREAQSQAAAAHRQQRKLLEDQLRSACTDGNIQSLQDELADRSIDELSAEFASVEDQVKTAEEDFGESTARVRELETQNKQIDGSADAAEADQQALSVIASMQTQVAAYARLRLAAAMLKLQVERHRAEHLDPMLARASSIFHTITCHHYAQLKIEYDDQDQPCIEGVRASGKSVPIAAMSDGTRDQLFLALRLAYIEQRIDLYEPLPFIVDDILIHFDDQRAVATLEQLVDLSTKTQVIFFTHHRHLVELATATLPADSVFLHHLDGSIAKRTTAHQIAATAAR